MPIAFVFFTTNVITIPAIYRRKENAKPLINGLSAEKLEEKSANKEQVRTLRNEFIGKSQRNINTN
jgi:hypothetical protein